MEQVRDQHGVRLVLFLICPKYTLDVVLVVFISLSIKRAWKIASCLCFSMVAKQLDKGVLFLKKLRCCVGGEYKEMFDLSTELITKGKLATVKRFEWWRLER